MVHAMPAVKLHAWEPAARARVSATRGRELEALWQFQVRGAAGTAFAFASPVLMATAALAVGYHSSTHFLTPAAAFATLALMRLMQTPLRSLPEAVQGAQCAWQSLHNLSHFMDQEELDPYAVAGRDSQGMVAKYDPQDVIIAVEDATLGWATNGPVIFQHLDATVGAGELLVVHGRPGSGKSSFLSALLGEMQACDGSNGASGRVYVGGSIAYCPQQSWLQQTLSVRDNVLFGLPFDRRKYQRVLDACALVNPLAMLPTGDHTSVKDWKPTLGQQALVSLARACYSDADVYLLDDPLARVHPRSVARDIFSCCLVGLLRNKTRVVVTTRAEFICSEFVDDAIRFEDGGRLVHTRDIYEGKGRKEQGGDEDSDGEKEKVATDSWVHYSASGVDIVRTDEPPYYLTEAPADIELLAMENFVNASRNLLNERPLREFLSCETAAEAEWREGEWLHKCVRAYTQAIGGLRVALLIFILLFMWQALQLASELWVAYWVRSSSLKNLVADQLIYASLALGAGLLALGYSLSVAVAAVQGARRGFLSLASAFLHAPLAFFDAYGAGSGRSLSKRLSLSRRRELERAYMDKDLTALDARLPLAVGAVLAHGASTLTALLTAAVVTRYYAVLLVPVVYMYVQTVRMYLRPARDLLHLERRARHAARSHAAETLAGARVARAFGLAHVHRVLGHHFWLLDVAARDAHLGLHIDQWLALRVQLYGLGIVGIVAASSFLALRYTLSASVSALALYEVLVVDSGALESLAAVRGAVVITESAAYSTAAARRASAPLTPNEVNPSLSWPTKGDLRFDTVSFRDPAAAILDELTNMFEIGDGGAPPLALKGVSFRLQAGEKVAILESSTASSVSSRVVHEELRDATVLLLLPSATVSPQRDQAQRAMLLNAVDRVLVVVDGEMAELRTPADLAQAEQGPDLLAEVPGRSELSDLEHRSEDGEKKDQQSASAARCQDIVVLAPTPISGAPLDLQLGDLSARKHEGEAEKNEAEVPLSSSQAPPTARDGDDNKEPLEFVRQSYEVEEGPFTLYTQALLLKDQRVFAKASADAHHAIMYRESLQQTLVSFQPAFCRYTRGDVPDTISSELLCFLPPKCDQKQQSSQEQGSQDIRLSCPLEGIELLLRADALSLREGLTLPAASSTSQM
ncbi:ATP-binding Cassette (ABC) Superfamily [Phytophthora infestans T30-4]|uniref:ATP-binding Cassette (ABC) Superfamily n=1 Tax=Phytophthora infestans (strain T30-4) TaxID=403677 RepID=D0N9N1_PHYIT|nr:ATP-binding Cassette (ABC) Superfamily [Phytophthora infestans T30-4]EEY54519.1 ATP-binding Cassette (ABC) Superfamily [Phytophthora infestans T30-4]|eukprot:XP_002904341.1 ATP-binding Cassette (ABC) Superfamily [Phytophthora infestans T30-4]